MSAKTLKTIVQTLLLAVIAVVPFVKTITLYFPFVSGKAYVFRGIVALAFFFFAWLALKDKTYRPDFRNILVVSLILFFLAQILVAFFGVDSFFSFFSSIDRQDGVLQYGFWVLYFLMLVSICREKRDWQKLFSVFIVAAFLLSVYSFFNLDPAQPAFSGAFGNPAYFAAFLVFAIAFALICYERKFFHPGAIHRLLPAVAVFFSLTLLFAQIRGVYAGLAGGVFLFCALSFLFLRKENKKLANWGGVFALVGAAFLILLFSARNSEFVQQNHILSRTTEVADFWQVGSVRERLLNWNIALKAFREKPVFGWGPENYGAAANKYYDFRIGQSEPWFDRAHSQPLDTLATGGLILFSFYLFWIFAVFRLIWKIAKQHKVLSFILAGLFFAYWIQGFFLFDTLAVYLGLFPFLAYLVYQTSSNFQAPNFTISKQFPSFKFQFPNKLQFIIVAAGIFSLFLIYATVIVPWRANHAAWNFFNLTNQKIYKETKPHLEKAFSVNSPYTYWELRKMASWRLMEILTSQVDDDTNPSDIQEIRDLYDFIVPELERYVAARPTHPQIYHVLAEIYRLGFERLGKDDLDKAEILLKKAFLQSDLRVEYFSDFAKIALLRGDPEGAERILKEYTAKMPPEWGAHVPLTALGNFYFDIEKYQQALEQYDEAEKKGFQIHQSPVVYPRYMLAAESIEDYRRIVQMAQKHLTSKGPDSDTYFNIAVGYWHLGESEKAKEFFLKAVELNPEEYEQYRVFFEK